MSIDFAFRVAVAAELLPVLDELRQLRSEVASLRTATTPPQLEALSTILGCTKPAALARLARDPELRALGLRIGRSLAFRRTEVEGLLASRTRESRGGTDQH